MASFPEENHDLFNQGKSTGSGLFDLGDEASDGHGSACLDEPWFFERCHLEVVLTLMNQWLALQARQVRPCKFLMWKRSMVIWTEHGTPWNHRQR